MHQLLIEPLDSGHDRAAFGCGDPAINDYLCNGRIDEDVGRGGCTAKVGVLEEHGSRVICFYTLSATALRADAVPGSDRRRLPRYRLLPAALIGRIGVAVEFQGRRFGTVLLTHALHDLWQASRIALGVSVVLIEPKNERLAEYYARLGFKALPDHGLLMYQPMRTISRAFMGT